MKEFIRQKLVRPLVEQIKKGVTPKRLAMSCAFGVLVGTSPFFGITTALGILFGFVFRLNHVALQVANYCMYGPQLVSIPLYLHYGDRLFGVKPLSLSVTELKAEYDAGAWLFFSKFGSTFFHASVLWLLTAPLIVLSSYLVLHFFFRRWSVLNAGK